MIFPAPLLSIVFTSYTMERWRDICDLLDSIREQTFPRIEVVFVANKGQEQLLWKVEEYSLKRDINLLAVLNESQPGVNVRRNLGIERSSGEIVALVDDDVILTRRWAEEMVKTYADASVVAVTGPAVPLWESASMSWFPQEFYWMWGCTVWDWDDLREIRNVGGMNCSYRREALFKAGLYRPDIGPKGEGCFKAGRWFFISGEEVEFCLRLRRATGGRIIYNPQVLVYHKVYNAHFKFSNIVKRALNFGYTKRFLADVFKKDFSSGPVLDLEYDHLKHILFRMPLALFRELPANPAVAGRRFLLALAATFFTGFGYCIYFLRPVRKKLTGSGL